MRCWECGAVGRGVDHTVVPGGRCTVPLCLVCHGRIEQGRPMTLASTVAAPAPWSRSAPPRSAAIVGVDNALGLSQDRLILAERLSAAGWSVEVVDPESDRPYRAAINLHLELVGVRHFDKAATNIIIPNVEWWRREWTPLLQRPRTVAWTKTRDATGRMVINGARARYIGFTSRDQVLPNEGRQRVFLHVAGNSANRGTAALIEAWAAHPQWPPLRVVRHTAVECSATNVVTMRRVEDGVLRRLQNQALFHICPSEYEGFGHVLWEGLSCGAVLVTTAGPPMNEIGCGIGIAATRAAGWPVDRWHVDAASVTASVEQALALDDGQIATLRAQARRRWEEADAGFRKRLRCALEALS